MERLDKLKILIGIAATNTGEDDLLELLLEDAENSVLDIIGRDILPERLESVVVQLAVIAYNRRGTEGAVSQGEGGVSVSYLDALPPDMRKRLQNYPRKVGVIHADA